MLRHRTYRIYAAVIIIGIIYVIRLLQIQVLDDTYTKKAERISLRKQTIYPQRGLVFDRNNNLIVYNEPIFDLMVSIPLRIKGIDTARFCTLIEISREEFDTRITKAKKSGYHGKAVFKKNLTKKLFAQLQERLYLYKGFFFEIRQDRNYKYNSSAHILGYLGEVNKKDLEEQTDAYYEQGDFIGQIGLEKFYENELRGLKGQKYFYVDRSGVNKGSYKNGSLDKEPVDGKNLQLSIDIELQQYGEKLLANKMGSIVAIEPSTGQILALVSSPFYNPQDFNFKNRRYHYAKARNNPTKPIYNRAVSAPYPPGSTFKPIMALIGLESGAITENTVFGCPGYYRLGRRIIRCHDHTFNTTLERSIASSCNTYYCNTFKNMMQMDKYGSTENAYTAWRGYLQSFGLGSRLGVDVSGEQAGWLKEASYYDGPHGKGRWSYANIISLSFGQGELGLTPIQLANAASVIANRGYYYTPHVIRRIGVESNIPEIYRTKNVSTIRTEKFQAVVEGMLAVTQSGTSRGSSIPGLDICGKTGTVQNPHGKNHSVYFGFAPAVNPTIAIAVVVEESGYGATWAAPIANLMMGKHNLPDSLNQSRKYLETRIAGANLIPDKFKPKEDGEQE